MLFVYQVVWRYSHSVVVFFNAFAFFFFWNFNFFWIINVFFSIILSFLFSVLYLGSCWYSNYCYERHACWCFVVDWRVDASSVDDRSYERVSSRVAKRCISFVTRRYWRSVGRRRANGRQNNDRLCGETRFADRDERDDDATRNQALVRIITVLAVVMGVFFFIVGVARGQPVADVFIFGFVTIIVANVPQGNYFCFVCFKNILFKITLNRFACNCDIIVVDYGRTIA